VGEKRYGERTTLSISMHDEIGPDRTLHALMRRETIDGFCSRDTTTKGVVSLRLSVLHDLLLDQIIVEIVSPSESINILVP